MDTLRIYDRGYQDIPLDSIYYIQGQTNYSTIYFVEERAPVLVTRCVGHLHELLPGFIRLDKSHLINPAYVQSYSIQTHAPSFVDLSNSQRLPVSRRKASAVKRQLQEVRPSLTE